MNAEQYLNEALGGNMNISTLKPLAWHEIMEGYARHKIKEAVHSTSTNSPQTEMPTVDEVIGDRKFLLGSTVRYVIEQTIMYCARHFGHA